MLPFRHQFLSSPMPTWDLWKSLPPTKSPRTTSDSHLFTCFSFNLNPELYRSWCFVVQNSCCSTERFLIQFSILKTKLEQDYHCTAQALKWLYGFRTTLVSLVSWVFVAAFRSFPEGGNDPFLLGQPGPMLQGILLIVFWDHLCAADWLEWLEPNTWRWHVTQTSC